jgi:NADH-quinone oxidoreductase subunit J
VTDTQLFALATLLAAVGVWLLLPRGTSRGRVAGAALAGAAVALWASRLPRLDTWFDEGVFLLLAGITLVAAVATISLSNPVYCAIWFGMTLLGTSGLFMYQGAQFLAAATLLVYAGAILVTFLFVLMLAQPEGRAAYDRLSWEALVSATTGAVMVGILSVVLFAVPKDAPAMTGSRPTAAQLEARVLAPDHVARIGSELFGPHLLAVQVVGVLLLTALVGAAAIVAHARQQSTPQQSGELARRLDKDGSP